MSDKTMPDIEPMSDEELANLREFMGKLRTYDPDSYEMAMWASTRRLLARLDAAETELDELQKLWSGTFKSDGSSVQAENARLQAIQAAKEYADTAERREDIYFWTIVAIVIVAMTLLGILHN